MLISPFDFSYKRKRPIKSSSRMMRIKIVKVNSIIDEKWSTFFFLVSGAGAKVLKWCLKRHVMLLLMWLYTWFIGLSDSAVWGDEWKPQSFLIIHPWIKKRKPKQARQFDYTKSKIKSQRNFISCHCWQELWCYSLEIKFQIQNDTSRPKRKRFSLSPIIVIIQIKNLYSYRMRKSF
jgi:hypothetical protein